MWISQGLTSFSSSKSVLEKSLRLKRNALFQYHDTREPSEVDLSSAHIQGCEIT